MLHLCLYLQLSLSIWLTPVAIYLYVCYICIYTFRCPSQSDCHLLLSTFTYATPVSIPSVVSLNLADACCYLPLCMLHLYRCLQMSLPIWLTSVAVYLYIITLVYIPSVVTVNMVDLLLSTFMYATPVSIPSDVPVNLVDICCCLPSLMLHLCLYLQLSLSIWLTPVAIYLYVCYICIYTFRCPSQSDCHLLLSTFTYATPVSIPSVVSLNLADACYCLPLCMLHLYLYLQMSLSIWLTSVAVYLYIITLVYIPSVVTVNMVDLLLSTFMYATPVSIPSDVPVNLVDICCCLPSLMLHLYLYLQLSLSIWLTPVTVYLYVCYTCIYTFRCPCQSG